MSIEPKNYTIEEIKRTILELSDSVYIDVSKKESYAQMLPIHELTHEAIQKANAPKDDNQIKLL